MLGGPFLLSRWRRRAAELRKEVERHGEHEASWCSKEAKGGEVVWVERLTW